MDITVLVKDQCVHCKALERWLKKNDFLDTDSPEDGYEYNANGNIVRVFNMSHNEEAFDYATKTLGATQAPTVEIIDGEKRKIISGPFNPMEYATALKG